MKIYTRTGDHGETSLADGSRVPKNHPRCAAVGAIDELNSHLGLIRAEGGDSLFPSLALIQHQLFVLGGELATPTGGKKGSSVTLPDSAIMELEKSIDTLDQGLPPLKNFILPGGTLMASHLHIARAMCRRLEREMITLDRVDPIADNALKYVNRLGDLLFVMARHANFSAGVADVIWRG